MKKVRHFIGGEKMPPLEGDFLITTDLQTGAPFCEAALGSAEDVNRAVKHALVALRDWSRSSIDFRSKILGQLAEFLEKRGAMLSEVESKEVGMSFSCSQELSLKTGVALMRAAAQDLELDLKKESKVHDSWVGQPVGVVGVVLSWDMPLAELASVMAPALAHGNVMVIQATPRVALLLDTLSDLLNETGIPPGVVNIVYGLNEVVGEVLAAHAEVSRLVLLGQFPGIEQAIVQNQDQYKRLRVESGFRNSCFVFADADLKSAVQFLAPRTLIHLGQSRWSVSHIYVEETVFSRFTQLFEEEILRRHPWTLGFLVEPQIKGTLDEVAQKCQGAGCEVKRIHTSEALSLPSMDPGVCLVIVPHLEPLGEHEEVRGPLLFLRKFGRQDQVFEAGNLAHPGLEASIWTHDPRLVQRAASDLRVKTLRVNGGSKAAPALALDHFSGRTSWQDEFYSNRVFISFSDADQAGRD